MGIPGSSVVKILPADAAEVNLIPGLGRSPRKGNGNPLQYSCLGNPVDRGAWHNTVHRVRKVSDTTWQLNNKNTTNNEIAFSAIILLVVKILMMPMCQKVWRNSFSFTSLAGGCILVHVFK